MATSDDLKRASDDDKPNKDSGQGMRRNRIATRASNVLWLFVVCSLSLPGIFFLQQQRTHNSDCRIVEELVPRLQWVGGVRPYDQPGFFYDSWDEISGEQRRNGPRMAREDPTCVTRERNGLWEEKRLPIPRHLNIQWRSDGSAAFASPLDMGCGTTRDMMSCLIEDKRWEGESLEEDVKNAVFPITIVSGIVCDDVVFLDNAIWMRVYNDGIDGFAIVSIELPFIRVTTTHSMLQDADPIKTTRKECDSDQNEEEHALSETLFGLCFSSFPVFVVASIVGSLLRVPSMSAAVGFSLLLTPYFVQLGFGKGILFGIAVIFIALWVLLSWVACIVRRDRPDREVWSWAYGGPVAQLVGSIFCFFVLQAREVHRPEDVTVPSLILAALCVPNVFMAGKIADLQILVGIGKAVTSASTITSIYFVFLLGGPYWWILVVVSAWSFGLLVTEVANRRSKWARKVIHSVVFGLLQEVSASISLVMRWILAFVDLNTRAEDEGRLLGQGLVQKDDNTIPSVISVEM